MRFYISALSDTYRYSTAKPYQNTSIKLSPDGLLEPGLMQTQTIVYSAFKAPLSIVQGSQRTFFGYNFAQDRSVMYFGNSSTNKLLQPKRRFYSADGTMEITMTLATATLPASYEFTTYIGGDAYTAPALDRQVNNASSSIFYLHRDHLGTILAISNNLGDVVEKRLFDAWGDIVKVQNGAGVAQSRLLFLDRGYTGHEYLQSFRLINMNGRLYDPRLHRFLQPDNNLQEPYNTQNYNRYGYVLNNPLKYTDPSGEFTWSDFVAGAAIVAGAILSFVPGGQIIGGVLLSAGIGHFGATASNYFSAGSDTRGNWDASSTKAGINFSTTVDTDLGYGGGGKKDVANSNNPLESHPGVAVTGNTSTAAASFNNGPPVYDSLLYNGTELIWTDNKGKIVRFPATSGAEGKQNSKYQNLMDEGPVPEGTYNIDLMLNPNRIVEMFDDGQSKPDFGIQKLPLIFTNSKGVSYQYENWGNTRIRINQLTGLTYGRNRFYIHNSTKGYSSGCIEIGSGFVPKLLNYAKHYSTIILTVQYPSNNSSTLGNTWKLQKIK